MAAVGCVRPADEFRCSICLDMFTDPVSTSCGHNFCESCIYKSWGGNGPYQCPMCREVFDTKPQLKVNTLLSELLAYFKHEEQKAELRRVQQYEVDVTLDPDTAHPKLILSDDGKQVHKGDKMKKLPDNPQRFTCFLCTLAKQSFSSGKFYFEVQVKGNTKWYLGVVKESINRKGMISWRPQHGAWVMYLRNGNEYKAPAADAAGAVPVCLSVKSGLQKVGVFVDYEEGLVSFYDVHSSVLIYSFIDCYFNDKLLPIFSPCLKDRGNKFAPLIITPVGI